MVYTMRITVDGACRGNGQPGARGCAAAIFKFRRNMTLSRHSVLLANYPTPTNQRAELAAIILALKEALKKYLDLDTQPRLDLRISTDSKYAVSCMNEWIFKWLENGWLNAAGRPVVNRDLIKEAWDLRCELRQVGRVKFRWIPREENEDADSYCNEILDDSDWGYY